MERLGNLGLIFLYMGSNKDSTFHGVELLCL